MKKLLAVMALLAPLTFAVEEVSHIHGTISKIDQKTKTIVVKGADGTEHTFKFIGKTTVHGTEAAATDTFHGLKEGSEVVAHYTKKGSEETAMEVDKVGKDGLKEVNGTISTVDRKGKKLVVKAADGTEQTFEMTDHAAVGGAKTVGKETEKGAKTTVYYTEEAGKKIVHFFQGS